MLIPRRAVLPPMLAALACAVVPGASRAQAPVADGGHLVLTETEWQARLSPAAFDVLRREGTEAPFSSPLDHQFAPGTYRCAGCGHRLYSSAAKYDSHTGWPSFWDHLPGAVSERRDVSAFMVRTEIRCPECDGHLGHVFPDGPAPTGLRYCMNGVALSFEAA